MELTKEQFDNLKGYICNINFDHEIYGVQKTLKMIGVDTSQVDALLSEKLVAMEERKHYNKGLKKKKRRYIKHDII